MPQIHLRGIQIYYEDLGAGTPIVFVHGHPFDHTMWNYRVPHFSNTHRLILPDLRGYGRSEVVPGRVMMDEMALDILHLLAALQLGQVMLCGLSMGGQIVLEFLRLFPYKVKALIIVDSDARGETADSRRQRFEKVDSILRDGMKKHTEDSIHQYIAPASIGHEPVYTHLYNMMSNTSAEGAVAAHRGRAERRDHMSFLPQINVPTLIVVGEEDLFTPPDIAKLMSDNIPGARLARIPGAGHLPNMEAPEAFNDILEEFIAAL